MAEGKRALRQAFKRLEGELPASAASVSRRLRHPGSRLIRIPIALLLIVGGIFSFLPVLGIWMLPLGLLLIAYDVPFLQIPISRFTIWSVQKLRDLRERLSRRDGPRG